MTTRFVDRTVESAMIRTAASAREHVALLGPPGTGKSALVRAHHPHAFTRALSRYTSPDDLFGPVSITALERDEYVRATKGYLPEAAFAFLDEIFKASGAVLNTLLQVLNEREFDNGAGTHAVPLVSACVASNELPDADQDASGAIWDRILFRHMVRPLPTDKLPVMLGGGGEPVEPVTPEAIAGWRAAADALVASNRQDVLALLDTMIKLHRPKSDRRMVWVRDAIPHAVVCSGSHVGEVVASAWVEPDADEKLRRAIVQAVNKQFAKDSAEADKVQRILQLAEPDLRSPERRLSGIHALVQAAERLNFSTVARPIGQRLNDALTRSETQRLNVRTRTWLDTCQDVTAPAPVFPRMLPPAFAQPTTVSVSTPSSGAVPENIKRARNNLVLDVKVDPEDSRGDIPSAGGSTDGDDGGDL